jgi:hypothetical protein
LLQSVIRNAAQGKAATIDEDEWSLIDAEIASQLCGSIHCGLGFWCCGTGRNLGRVLPCGRGCSLESVGCAIGCELGLVRENVVSKFVERIIPALLRNTDAIVGRNLCFLMNGRLRKVFVDEMRAGKVLQ